MPCVHFLLGTRCRIGCDADAIADADRSFRDTHSPQDRQRARLDFPDHAVGAHAEVRVRVAPQNIRHLAFELDEPLRVEPAEEAVVRCRGPGPRNEDQQARSAGAHRAQKSVRLAEDEERLIGRAARAGREHHLAAVVGRVREQIALERELETGREHFLLDRVDAHAMNRPGVAPTRAVLGLVIDDEVDSARLQRLRKSCG